MSGYEVARLDEIVELDDGRIPFRPVRHHFGITSFGITAWTARAAGDRMINEHDEDDDGSGRNVPLYPVTAGRARFEPRRRQRRRTRRHIRVRTRAAVTRTAFAEEAGTTIVAMGATSGSDVRGARRGDWSSIRPIYERGRARRASSHGSAQSSTRIPSTLCCSSTSRVARPRSGIRPRRSTTSGARSSCPRSSSPMPRDDSDLDPIRGEPGFKEIVGDLD